VPKVSEVSQAPVMPKVPTVATAPMIPVQAGPVAAESLPEEPLSAERVQATVAPGTGPVPEGPAPGEDPLLTIERLRLVNARQEAMITALVEASERRLSRPSDDSAFGRWEQNVVLHQEVENRTRRIGAAERLLRSVVDSLDGRMCIIGAEGLIVGTNRLWDEFCEEVGWPETDSGVGANFFTLIQRLRGELSKPLAAATRDILDGSGGQSSLRGYLPLVGRGEDIIVRLHPVLGHDEGRVVITIIDISEPVRTERELRRISHEAQLLALVAQHTDSGVVISDLAGQIEWVNDAFCRSSGFSLEELVGVRRLDLVDGPFAQTPSFIEFSAALSTGQGAELQFPTQTKDGGCYWVHVEAQPVLEDGTPVRFVSVERDITSQRAAEEQLRAATRRAQLLADQLSSEKALLSEVLASIPHMVYWKDPELRYIGVNQAFLGLRGLVGEHAVLERLESELDCHDELSAVLARLEQQVLETGEPVENQRLILAPSDRPRCSLLLSVLPKTDEDGTVCGVIGVAADVTHVSTLEQQLAQASRLESIGQLAAGIAHEINTPVQYVSDNTRFLVETFEEVMGTLRAVEALARDTEPVADRLQALLKRVDLEFLGGEIPSALTQSLEGLERVSQIVRAMKDFSHPGQGRVAADLNRAVESTVQVSRNEWRYVAVLDLDLDPDVGLVRCHEGELKQVLLNIVVNAAQAISGARSRKDSETLGRITLKTERVGGGVRITVADDGPGMVESVRSKIFDPFFTTKPVGQGTGQGLSMAYAVIQKHGGTLAVESAPGTGATFTIDLPDDPAG
jgi:two-component system NtrC family sensor kinase